MTCISKNSLAETLDRVNEKHFFNQSITKNEIRDISLWLASRQGKPDSYADLFAPFKKDLAEGIKVFTGERIQTNAATRHILGEETARVLILLKDKSPEVQSALKKATSGMTRRLHESLAEGYSPGMYCCGRCTCSLFRHLAVGGLKDIDPELWINQGMKQLKKHRLGDGTWKRFPFYYTLLTLSELDSGWVKDEIKYALPICEKRIKGSGRNDPYSLRRRILMERILIRYS